MAALNKGISVKGKIHENSYFCSQKSYQPVEGTHGADQKRFGTILTGLIVAEIFNLIAT